MQQVLHSGTLMQFQRPLLGSLVEECLLCCQLLYDGLVAGWDLAVLRVGVRV